MEHAFTLPFPGVTVECNFTVVIKSVRTFHIYKSKTFCTLKNLRDSCFLLNYTDFAHKVSHTKPSMTQLLVPKFQYVWKKLRDERNWQFNPNKHVLATLLQDSFLSVCHQINKNLNIFGRSSTQNLVIVSTGEWHFILYWLHSNLSHLS